MAKVKKGRDRAKSTKKVATTSEQKNVTTAEATTSSKVAAPKGTKPSEGVYCGLLRGQQLGAN